MTNPEFSNEFDVLYNNIMSNAAPGLNEYEKSVFLTKAQDEVIKNYFNPKGNKYQEGFDDSAKRQIDFSMLMKTTELTPLNPAIGLHLGQNIQFYSMPQDIMLYINEFLDVTRKGKLQRLTVIPLKDDEYARLMSKPFKRPLKYQAWRLISSGAAMEYTYTDYAGIAVAIATDPEMDATSDFIYQNINRRSIEIVDATTIKIDGLYLSSDGSLVGTQSSSIALQSGIVSKIGTLLNARVSSSSTIVQLIPGPSDNITNYLVRYIRRPLPIILENLEDISIEGYTTELSCELDPILHQEILQRAVELAKAAYSGEINTIIETGKRSE